MKIIIIKLLVVLMLSATQVSAAQSLAQQCGQAIPMTYRVGGRQVVVIAAGGYGRMPIDMGDSLVAFALPDK